MNSREQPPMLAADPRPGFTLVELMVTIVIISILASLSLAGLNVTRGRARADATRSTIRKLNEIIIPHYERYMRRRVPALSGTPTKTDRARDRLLKIRTLQMREMPDTWADVYANLATVNALTGTNAYLKTAAVRSYAQLKSTLTAPETAYGSEECLYMIIARGGFEPDILETFRSDEIADKDGDGAPEFVDGWGTPIAFLRWAPGFCDPPLSLIQSRAIANGLPANPDPFDPFRVDTAAAGAYALVPVIVSAGPDTTLGLQMPGEHLLLTGWSGLLPLSTIVEGGGAAVGSPLTISPPEHADNLSNHTFAAE